MIPSRILVATDGSAPAVAAEVLAADLAGLMSKDRPVEVVVLSVVHDVGHVTAAGGVIPPSAEVTEAQIVSSAGVDRIEALLRSRPGDNPIEVRSKVIQAMSPGPGIVEEAHATGACSLIVLGNRGQGAFAEALLGSVSSHVVRKAHCPVMIARA